jgi:hypothetical protein
MAPPHGPPARHGSCAPSLRRVPAGPKAARRTAPERRRERLCALTHATPAGRHRGETAGAGRSTRARTSDSCLQVVRELAETLGQGRQLVAAEEVRELAETLGQGRQRGSCIRGASVQKRADHSHPRRASAEWLERKWLRNITLLLAGSHLLYICAVFLLQGLNDGALMLTTGHQTMARADDATRCKDPTQSDVSSLLRFSLDCKTIFEKIPDS